MQKIDNNYNDYDFAIVLNNNIKEEQITLVCFFLKDHGFSVIHFYYNSTYFILAKFIKLSHFLKEAESLRIMKKTSESFRTNSENTKLSKFRAMIDRREEKNLDMLDTRIRLYEKYETISASNLEKFINNFPPNVTNIDNLPISYEEKILSLFNSSERVRIKFHILTKLKLFDLRIMDFLEQHKFLMKICPLYEEVELKNDLKIIESNFGQKIVIYFIFFQTFLKFLIYPAIPGLFFLYYFPFIQTTFSHFNHFYSILIVLWAQFFLIAWQRKESELSIEWGSYGKIFKLFDKNKDFKGDPTINLVSGVLMEKYSKKKRFYQYFISFLESLVFLSIGLLFKIVFLNLKGFIVEGELFFIKSIDLQKKSGFLSKTTNINNILSYIIQNEIIVYLNIIYKKVCGLSTIRENHKTNKAKENSIIIKRFLFEFLNRFSDIGYLAFYKMDLTGLQYEILAFFILGETRRILNEFLIPMLNKNLSKTSYKIKKELMNKEEEFDNLKAETMLEIQLKSYDNFDDYLELIFQFCYLVLFAGVFPHGGYLALIFNIIEYYSDSSKLVKKLYSRPLPEKTNGIGIWLNILIVLSLLAVPSNTFFFIFFSHKNAINEKESNFIENNYIWEKNVAFAIAIEHTIFLIIYILNKCLKKDAKWTRIFRKRQKI